MKVYVSASLLEAEKLIRIYDFIRGTGHDIVNRIQRNGVSSYHLDADLILKSQVFMHLSDVRDPDTHVELGMALSTRRIWHQIPIIYVIGTNANECPHYSHPDVDARVILDSRSLEEVVGYVLSDSERRLAGIKKIDL